MANHRRQTPTLRSLSKRQWIKFTAILAAVGMFAGAGFISRNFYVAEHRASGTSQVSSYSATDSDALEVSRGVSREALRHADKNASYVTVKVNGQSRTVLGYHFTDVKSVLDAGDITLEPDDKVSPSLTSEVSESTVITIERAGTQVETSQEPIAFNTVKKETDDLPKGTEKVETEGQKGVMEITSLVTRSGDTVVSSNVFTSYVKKAPVDKVILVGTGVDTTAETESNAASDTASVIGTTTPVGDMQQWAHDYLLANGYSESDFTATVYIISHESGWRVNATNAASGAYGLAQALPGSKMASAGSDWATNYQTQLKWFWSYCASRYGSIQGAYNFWVANNWY